MNFLTGLYWTYIAVAFYIFFQFCVGNISCAIYNKKTDEYLELSNWEQGLFISLFSMAWPITLYYLFNHKED